MMGRKRSASLEKILLSKKSLQEVITQQTWAENFLRESADPAAPYKVLPDKLMHLPALIFWTMLASMF